MRVLGGTRVKKNTVAYGSPVQVSCHRLLRQYSDSFLNPQSSVYHAAEPTTRGFSLFSVRPFAHLDDCRRRLRRNPGGTKSVPIF